MECRLEQKYYDTLRVVLNNHCSLPRSPRTCEDVAEDVKASEDLSGMCVLKIVMKNNVMKHRARSMSQAQLMKCSACYFSVLPHAKCPLSHRGSEDAKVKSRISQRVSCTKCLQHA